MTHNRYGQATLPEVEVHRSKDPTARVAQLRVPEKLRHIVVRFLVCYPTASDREVERYLRHLLTA